MADNEFSTEATAAEGTSPLSTSTEVQDPKVPNSFYGHIAQEVIPLITEDIAAIVHEKLSQAPTPLAQSSVRTESAPPAQSSPSIALIELYKLLGKFKSQPKNTDLLIPAPASNVSDVKSSQEGATTTDKEQKSQRVSVKQEPAMSDQYSKKEIDLMFENQSLKMDGRFNQLESLIKDGFRDSQKEQDKRSEKIESNFQLLQKDFNHIDRLVMALILPLVITLVGALVPIIMDLWQTKFQATPKKPDAAQTQVLESKNSSAPIVQTKEKAAAPAKGQ